MLAEAGSGSAWSVLALDYELGYLLEPASAPPGWKASSEHSLARCWRFSSCQMLDAAGAEKFLRDQLAALPETDRIAGFGGINWGTDFQDYAAKIERIKRYIADGDCYQVNYTFPLHFSWFGHPLALYAGLRARQPVRYGGMLTTHEGAVLSLSPELFFQRQGDRLLTRPMKGTASRSLPQEVLRNSTKDRAENLMIVDLLRNDLGRIARPGSVQVESLFEIEDFPTLWQMTSQIAAEIPGKGLREILPALFPCGSITGAPKIRAMQIAGQLETGERGLYTGSLGWMAPNGDGRLNVAIRTLELAPDGSGRMGLGSGIVADSDALAEWRECQTKAKFLTGMGKAGPALKLIETLLRENGCYPRLERHLDRLRTSAAWLAFPFDESGVRQLLEALPVAGTERVRLTLDGQGRLEVSAVPLGQEPAGPRFARMAAAAIDSRQVLQGHKTTVRQVYDRALSEIAALPAVFDTVFVNERGEVAEGARSTVFVEREGVLLTPPVTSGALPGVLRAELIASGRAKETVLFPDDLVSGFWLGNALRGLIPVILEKNAGESRG